jgi:hypothetical protein
MEESNTAPANTEGQKYELTDETIIIWGTTLHRIRALRDLSRYGVKAGDLGGFVEKWHNLSHEGNSWVFNDAAVWGNARVFGDAALCDYAYLYDDAELCDRAVVADHAQVCNAARVYEQALVCGHARVCDEAVVCDSARVSDRTQVGGCAIVSVHPITISGLIWDVVISDYDMRIGCQIHPFEEWENFTDSEIDEMSPHALAFWKEYKEHLIGLCRLHAKNVPH